MQTRTFEFKFYRVKNCSYKRLLNRDSKLSKYWFWSSVNSSDYKASEKRRKRKGVTQELYIIETRGQPSRDWIDVRKDTKNQGPCLGMRRKAPLDLYFQSAARWKSAAEKKQSAPMRDAGLTDQISEPSNLRSPVRLVSCRKLVSVARLMVIRSPRYSNELARLGARERNRA